MRRYSVTVRRTIVREATLQVEAHSELDARTAARKAAGAFRGLEWREYERPVETEALEIVEPLGPLPGTMTAEEVDAARRRLEESRERRIAEGRCIGCGTAVNADGRCPHEWTGEGVPPRGKHVPALLLDEVEADDGPTHGYDY